MADSDKVIDAGNVIGSMDAATLRDPHAMYEQMRDAGPAVRTENAFGGGTVLVARRSMVEQVLRQPELFSSAGFNGMFGADRPGIPIELDPPEQRRYRKYIDPLFSPQRMRALEPSINRLVNDLIDDFGDATEIDFAKQFSIPFPSQVFLTLIGLPLGDLSRFLEMKDGLLRPHIVLGVDFADPRCQTFKAEIAQVLYSYFNEALDEREAERTDDVLSGLLDAEVQGQRLSREEILDICFPLFVGGLDTVSASLDCFFTFLAEHPGHRRQLVDDPSLIPSAVEELFRWETPVMMAPRTAVADADLDGCPVKSGDLMFVFFAAANTDSDGIPDPEEVRFDREGVRNFAFGGGVHRCLGSNLARVELRTALSAWHSRIPEYRIKPGVELQFTPVIRTTETFPMLLGTSIES